MLYEPSMKPTEIKLSQNYCKPVVDMPLTIFAQSGDCACHRPGSLSLSSPLKQGQPVSSNLVAFVVDLHPLVEVSMEPTP